MKKLGHLLVVGMVLSLGARLNESIVLKLVHLLLWESLQYICLVSVLATEKGQQEKSAVLTVFFAKWLESCTIDPLYLPLGKIPEKGCPQRESDRCSP